MTRRGKKTRHSRRRDFTGGPWDLGWGKAKRLQQRIERRRSERQARKFEDKAS